MGFWILLWKITLIGGLAVFACLAVCVTIGGYYDIKRLFAKLSADQAPVETDQTEKTA
jgi:hypothetical protein